MYNPWNYYWTIVPNWPIGPRWLGVVVYAALFAFSFWLFWEGLK